MNIHQSKNVSLSSAKTILLLGVYRLGDMVFATPAIKMFKDALPQAQFDIAVTSEIARQTMSYNPSVRKIISVRYRWQVMQLAKKYDAVVMVHDNPFFYECCMRMEHAFFYQRNEESNRLPMRERPALFIRTILDKPDLPLPNTYLLYPQPQHFQTVTSFLNAQSVNMANHTLVCCHMGCRRVGRRGRKFLAGKYLTRGTKSWGVPNFAWVFERFEETHPTVKFVLTGVKGERRMVTPQLAQSSNVIDMIGRTSVLELAALIRTCSTLLTTDTGTLHVGCSTDIPIVALFGPTDSTIYGPYPRGPHRIVLQKSESVPDITRDEVYAALAQLLDTQHVAQELKSGA